MNETNTQNLSLEPKEYFKKLFQLHCKFNNHNIHGMIEGGENNNRPFSEPLLLKSLFKPLIISKDQFPAHKGLILPAIIKNPQVQKQKIQKNNFIKLDHKNSSEYQEIEESIDLSVSLQRKSIKSNSGPQIIPMLISLKIQDIESISKIPIDLICVIDTSSSMSSKKISFVKDAMNSLLQLLKNEDRLSVITFNSQASCMVPLVYTTGENKAKIMEHINLIKVSHLKNIDLGLRKAFDIIKSRTRCNPVTNIFLFSDGLELGAQERIKESLKSYNIEKDISINTFTFNNKSDTELMNEIASLRDGKCCFIQYHNLEETFVDCLGGLLSVVAKDIKIVITAEQSRFLQGVEVVGVYGEEEVIWSQYKDDSKIKHVARISGLLCGSQRDFALEVKITPNLGLLHEKTIKVVDIKAEINIVSNGLKIIKNAEAIINVLNKNEVPQRFDFNREATISFYEIKCATLLRRARLLAEQGNYKIPHEILTSFLQELASSCLKQKEPIKNMMIDIDIAIEKIYAHGLIKLRN